LAKAEDSGIRIIGRWVMRTQRVLLVPLVLALSVGVAMASEEVRITFPHLTPDASRRGNLLVLVHYSENDKNRELELVWNSEAESGSSVVEINAENNGIPISKTLVLSAGEYKFVATLYRSDGSTVVATQTRYVTR